MVIACGLLAPPTTQHSPPLISPNQPLSSIHDQHRHQHAPHCETFQTASSLQTRPRSASPTSLLPTITVTILLTSQIRSDQIMPPAPLLHQIFPRRQFDANAPIAAFANEWSNPSNYAFTILLLLGGDVITRALAQLAGGIVTPVAFSFGTLFAIQ
jgi:hypothetical protein